MARAWYILSTYSGYEDKVKSQMEKEISKRGWDDIIYQIKVPSEKVVVLGKGGKKKEVERKFFPGYILVEMDIPDDETRWADIYSTIRRIPGVRGFLSFGDRKRPHPVSPDEVREIFGRMGEFKKEGVAFQVELKEGDVVRITDGPFIGLTGRVGEVRPDKGKVKVMVEIFGRVTPIELDFNQVEKE